MIALAPDGRSISSGVGMPGGREPGQRLVARHEPRPLDELVELDPGDELAVAAAELVGSDGMYQSSVTSQPSRAERRPTPTGAPPGASGSWWSAYWK